MDEWDNNVPLKILSSHPKRKTSTQIGYFLCFVDHASLRNLVNKATFMQNFS